MEEHPIQRSNSTLRDERLQRQWTQQTLADRLETTKLTISRWERGISVPGPYFRLKLCALFGKSAEELGLVEVYSLPPNPPERDISGEEPMHSSPTNTSALWTVPYRRNPYFTGRDELLHLLDRHLSEARSGEATTIHHAALTQPQAIKGLGGIGKTQIAVEYAYRARDQGQYTHILWINAASKETLMTSFTLLADVLPAFSAQNETNQQKLIEAMKRWLEQCQERWLLIFDNADDLSLLQKYIPHYGNGSILLTTRANAVGSFAVSIEVENMGFVEGMHLLLHRAQRFAQVSDEEMNEAGNIVVALDHFPLALEQAGAYIEETGCSFGSYLQLYQSHRSVLLARRGAQTVNYPDSVATTWLLSFQKVEQTNPAAVELLKLCAFLAPDHIPEELLKDAAQHWPPLLQQAVTDLFAFNEMLEVLLSFSLIKRLTENSLLSIHRLVQVVQLDRIDSEEQSQWAERVVRAVNTMFPRDPKDDVASWSQCLRYLEQVQTCFTLIQELTLTLTEGADLLNRTGSYLFEHASYVIAESLFQQALHIWEQSAEPHDARMISSLNNLAILYRQQGKYPEAESLLQRVLSIWKQRGGYEHIDTTTALNELAVLYGMQGKYTEAEPLFQQALQIREQSLGPDHPQVASSLNSLAMLYRQQGKYTEAEPLLQRALYIRKQSLGPDHPQTASSLTGLAGLYSQLGKYAEAVQLYQRALHIWEQKLGPTHRDVVIPLNNLAELYRAQGKYEEAESLYQRILHTREQNPGPEHSLVAYSLDGLANLCRDQGRYTEAEPLYQRALHIRKQHLGPEHPEVAYSLNGLASLYYHQGKYEQAEQLYRQAFAIRETLLGQHHPDLATTLNDLGGLYFQTGKYEQAEPLFARALNIQEQTLPSRHPDLAITLHGCARLSEEQGNLQKAAAFYQRSLTIREHVYGLYHSKTIETRESLHVVLRALGKAEDEVNRQQEE